MFEVIKKNGYSINIEIEEGSPCPWEAMDGNPPLLTYDGDGELQPYGEELCMEDVYKMIPEKEFDLESGRFFREMRMEIQSVFLPPASFTKDDIVEALDGETDPEELKEAASAFLPEPPSSGGLSGFGWNRSDEWFRTLRFFCELANIQCHYETMTDGHDSVRVFAVATPKWLELIGLSPTDTDVIQAQLKDAVELWNSWRSGEVYFVASILRPNGEELDDSCCGGFYGTDHEESGLLSFAENAIAADPLSGCRQ